MKIKNNDTGKQYNVSKEGWESMSKSRQSLFTIVSESDSGESIPVKKEPASTKPEEKEKPSAEPKKKLTQTKKD